MAIAVKAPDGATVNFPDGTDDATISGVMRREYGGPNSPAIAPLTEFRSRYPQYSDMQDDALADALHSKFYSDMDRTQFNARVGFTPRAAGRKNALPSDVQLPTVMSDDPEHDQTGIAMANAVANNAPARNPLVDVPRMFSPRQQPSDTVPAAEPRTPQPGEVLSRGTVLPFLETMGPDGRPRQSLGLPGIISEPLEAADRLISRPAAAGSYYAPGGDNSQLVRDATTIAMTAIPAGRRMASNETLEAIQATQPRPGTIGPPVPPARPMQGPPAPPPAPVPPTPAVQQTVGEMARDLGVDLPRAAAGGRNAQIIAGALREIPGIGAPIVRAAERASGQLEGAVTRVADDLGPTSRQGAGLAARDEIVGWMRGGSRDAARAAYDELDKIVNSNLTVPLSRTEIAARNIRARDQASATSDGAAALALVDEALSRPGGLTYEGIKGLRTSIMERIDGTITGHGISQNNLRALRTALNEDVRFAVHRAGVKGGGGKKALAAFERANSEAAAAEGRRETLTKIIGSQADANGEAIVDRIVAMAGAKKGADIARVLQARSAMGRDAWEDVAGSVLRSMGQAKDGWSLARWRTDFGRLSDEGREALFGSGPGSHGETLGKIFEIARHAEQLNRMGNPSGTGRMATVVSGPGWMIADPVSFTTAVIGGAILSRALAKPISAKAAERTMQAAKQHAERPSNATRTVLLQSVRQLAATMGESEAEAEERARELLDQQSGERPQ